MQTVTQTVSTVTHDGEVSQLQAVVTDGEVTQLTLRIRDSEGNWTPRYIEIWNSVDGMLQLSFDLSLFVDSVQEAVRNTRPNSAEA